MISRVRQGGKIGGVNEQDGETGGVNEQGEARIQEGEVGEEEELAFGGADGAGDCLDSSSTE